MYSLKKIALFLLVIVLVSQGTVITSCTKPDDEPQDTISPPPPPPPPLDTVTLVRRLEMHTSLYPSYAIKPYRTFSFYYDNAKRVTTVGIKNYSLVLIDSVTTRFEYSGSNTLPSLVIQGDLKSPIGGPAAYDTCWFTYGAGNKLIKDSTNERLYASAGVIVRRPLVRSYSYPVTGTTIVNWNGYFSASGPQGLLRRDTIERDANSNPTRIKMQYADPATGLGSYARGEGFNPGTFSNPLALLNISGSAWSTIYPDVRNEMLGNQYHPLVFNSNGLAEYLDFLSAKLPTLFYIGGYNKLNQMISSSAAGFVVTVTPWSLRASYPSELRVTISTSLAGDSYYYRYFY